MIGLLSWAVHVIACIAYFTSGSNAIAYVLFLIVGIFFPPIGAIHGFGIMMGVW